MTYVHSYTILWVAFNSWDFNVKCGASRLVSTRLPDDNMANVSGKAARPAPTGAHDGIHCCFLNVVGFPERMLKIGKVFRIHSWEFIKLVLNKSIRMQSWARKLIAVLRDVIAVHLTKITFVILFKRLGLVESRINLTLTRRRMNNCVGDRRLTRSRKLNSIEDDVV